MAERTPVHDLADRRRLKCSITETATENPLDPTTLTFYLTEPDGTKYVYVYGIDSELEKDTDGVYYVDWLCVKPGTHYWNFTAAGNIGEAEEKKFRVRASKAK